MGTSANVQVRADGHAISFHSRYDGHDTNVIPAVAESIAVYGLAALRDAFVRTAAQQLSPSSEDTDPDEATRPEVLRAAINRAIEVAEARGHEPTGIDGVLHPRGFADSSALDVPYAGLVILFAPEYADWGASDEDSDFIVDLDALTLTSSWSEPALVLDLTRFEGRSPALLRLALDDLIGALDGEERSSPAYTALQAFLDSPVGEEPLPPDTAERWANACAEVARTQALEDARRARADDTQQAPSTAVPGTDAARSSTDEFDAVADQADALDLRREAILWSTHQNNLLGIRALEAKLRQELAEGRYGPARVTIGRDVAQQGWLALLERFAPADPLDDGSLMDDDRQAGPLIQLGFSEQRYSGGSHSSMSAWASMISASSGGFEEDQVPTPASLAAEGVTEQAQLSDVATYLAEMASHLSQLPGQVTVWFQALVTLDETLWAALPTEAVATLQDPEVAAILGQGVSVGLQWHDEWATAAFYRRHQDEALMTALLPTLDAAARYQLNQLLPAKRPKI